MEMETKLITRINNVDIVSTSDEQMIPIRPICEALGIDFPSQYKKLQEDEDLSPTVVLSTTVGADGKDRKMVCLPVEFIFGWLFTISPSNVATEAKERTDLVQITDKHQPSPVGDILKTWVNFNKL